MELPRQLQGVLWTLAVLLAITAAQEESREVPIIKQINRVNDDGTYTFGYEAADGSFKIETRDVLGNVKGMFGYIDDRGQLKRVSYTANNGTGFQATGTIPDSGVTRRPVLVYRGINRPVTEGNEEEEEASTTASYGDYLLGRRGYGSSTTEEPTTRPVKVLVTKRPVLDSRSPNVIRRQLDRDRDDYSAARRFRYQQQALDPREVYRNQLLEQHNLKPDYPSRTRYYPVEEDYPAATAVARPRYAPAAPPVPPPAPGYRGGYEDQFFPPDPRRLPFRPPRPYEDQYLPPPPDYEAFRAAMNYLLQYLQYMRRMDPYPPAPYPPYPVDPYAVPRGPRPYYPPPRFPPGPPLPVPVPSPFSANVPYLNPNVQYSTGQDSAQEALANLKTRMDHTDQSDSGDTRPPTASLIRALLSRQTVTQRPAIRSVEILGTAKSTTSTTTERADVMEASS